MIGHRVKVDIGEIQCLFGAVMHMFTRQVAVQVHLPQPDRVAHVVTAFNGGDGTDIRLI